MGRDKKLGEIDYLERNYSNYFSENDFSVIPLPNKPSLVRELLLCSNILVLSGGNETFSSNPRAITEEIALKEAIAHEVPVLGICRGFQAINEYFGGSITKTPPTHKTGTNHEVMIIKDVVSTDGKSGPTNSYHNDCIMSDTLASSLEIFSITDDGVVEGFYHPKKQIIAVQWHPERDKKLSRWVDEGLLKYISTKDF